MDPTQKLGLAAWGAIVTWHRRVSIAAIDYLRRLEELEEFSCGHKSYGVCRQMPSDPDSDVEMVEELDSS